jgi:mannose-1-phosphate guanylyltransferase
MRVRRFTEKPNADKAAEFVESGHYFWNSGIFVWGAKTLANALREHLRETAPFLEKIAASYGTPDFQRIFARLYPKCENISVDYAVLEPRSAKGEHSSNIFCIPADWGWNDLGSWAALFEHRAAEQKLAEGENVMTVKMAFTHEAGGNFVHSPKKFVAVVGVKDLVIVETEDALLITTRKNSQDVGKVVKFLDDKKLKNLV